MLSMIYSIYILLILLIRSRIWKYISKQKIMSTALPAEGDGRQLIIIGESIIPYGPNFPEIIIQIFIHQKDTETINQIRKLYQQLYPPKMAIFS